MQQGEAHPDGAPSNLKKRYDEALANLKQHPGGLGAYHEVLSEAAELAGLPKEAVEELDVAISYDDRFELRLRRWKIMSRDDRLALDALSELEELKADPRQAMFRDAHLKELVEIFVKAMSRGIHSPQRLNRFAAPLGSRDIGAIVSRVRRRQD